MKISEIIKNNKTTLSFEVFPPKTGDKYSSVETAVTEITKLKPDFMSVTYGAGGGANNVFTAQIASGIEKNGITALAHLTCVGSDNNVINQRLEEFSAAGIENILALRGDIPAGASPDAWSFRHANDLAAEIYKRGKFCIGGACYPEKHPESPSVESDIEMLKRKAEAGCSFFTTQMFFDNDKFYRFLEKARAAGIDLPIIAGIMPITSAKMIKRSCELSGTAMPRRVLDMVNRFGDDPDCMYEAGLAYASEQIVDLIANGVANIHVYVMNKPATAARIRHDLGHILPVHNI